MSDALLLDRARTQAADASRRAGIDIEPLGGPRDAQAASDLLSRVWHMPPGIDVMELSTLVALAHSGNYVAIARSHTPDRVVIAASVGFFGPPGQPLHSHITGVAGSAVGRGIGRALKLHQRAWAIGRGVMEITWTFDPLVARNAFFNISTMGARAVAYYPDHYGPMIDGLNAGQGSDRMLMRWDLTADLPMRGANAAASSTRHTDQDVRHINIPLDIEALRRTNPDQAIEWRTATRAAFTKLVGEGWRVTGIERPARYILTKEHG
ncbi:MAG: hypothetical protein WA880_12010 [Ornithinimicrobium sp.]